MSDDFKIVIPARYISTRYQGKLLASIKGKPMIQHVYDNAVASGASEIVIATDSMKIGMRVEEFGAKVCMTSEEHNSGTLRIAEVIDKLGWNDQTLIVNLQGDEPLVPATAIKQVVSNLLEKVGADCATLCTVIDAPVDVSNPDIVKIVKDSNNYAMYFSRSVIPCQRYMERGDSPTYYRHIGLYTYYASLLREYKKLPVSDIESTEELEQLHMLWNGMRIYVAETTEVNGPAVETPDDLERVKAIIASTS